MTRPFVPDITLSALCERYAAVFLDAYGVLVNGQGALPGAAGAIAFLNDHGIPWLVLTNDASRSPATASQRFRSLGLDISPARVLSSGDLLAGYFADHGLQGARCVVLGSRDSAGFVTDAGGVVVPAAISSSVEAVVVCDDAGYPFLDTVSDVLSLLFNTIDGGRVPALLLPNPDLIYPRSEGRYGFTAGTVAEMFERALALRYPERDDLRFVRLGKPFAPIFTEGFRRVGTRDVVMIGDQLVTDIAGARAAGIDSALATTGLTRLDEAQRSATAPTYILRGW